MLRTFLIATALLTTSGAALARDYYDYGRTVSSPHVSITLSSGHPVSYPVVYEPRHAYYAAPRSYYYPNHYVVAPPYHGRHDDYSYRAPHRKHGHH